MKLSLAVVAMVSLALSGRAMAQEAAGGASADEVACADILATPSVSVEEIAALNDTSVVTVLRCREAEANAAEPGAGVADLRSAVAANPSLAPSFTAAGAAPDQVVAFRKGPNGEFMFYVIGAFR